MTCGKLKNNRKNCYSTQSGFQGNIREEKHTFILNANCYISFSIFTFSLHRLNNKYIEKRNLKEMKVD